MTTPQDIQAALDEMIDGRAEVGDWFLKHKETLRHVLQSHAIPRHNMNLNESVQAIGRKSKSKKFQSEVIGDLTILFDAPESCPSENTVFEKQDFLSSVDKNQKND